VLQEGKTNGAFAVWVHNAKQIDCSKGKASKTKEYIVYVGKNKKRGIKYVGITKRELSVRAAEHIAAGGGKEFLRYEIYNNSVRLTRRQARVIEQNMINNKGLGNLLNEINSINKKNWKKYGVK